MLVVREEICCAQPSSTKEQADANALAALIGGAIRLWECTEDPAVPPRLVRHDRLAVQADELAALIAKLTQSAAGSGFPLGPGER
jgi:hypothetical protein